MATESADLRHSLATPFSPCMGLKPVLEFLALV